MAEAITYIVYRFHVVLVCDMHAPTSEMVDVLEAQDESLERPRAALAVKLEAFGMMLEPMPGDNNCQFHAISDQLRYVLCLVCFDEGKNTT